MHKYNPAVLEIPSVNLSNLVHALRHITYSHQSIRNLALIGYRLSQILRLRTITMPQKVTSVQITSNPETHENEHVHKIYDQIATHFSSTRYKPWPIISAFMSSIPTGWIGLDAGTGNGKYLPLPLDRPGNIWTIGLDRSRKLLDIARKMHPDGTNKRVFHEVVWGDVLGNGWRQGAFDFAISIATIHHLATPARRRMAVKRLLNAVSSYHGRILIYVWGIEQDELSTRQLPEAIDEGTAIGQDVFVPWVLSPSLASKGGTQLPQESAVSETDNPPQIFNRYYHMFAKDELSQLVIDTATELDMIVGTEEGKDLKGVEIVQGGWERSNYFVELRCWMT